MAGNTSAEINAFRQKQESPTAGLESKFDELLSYLKGDDVGGTSGSLIQLGRRGIKDIKKGVKEFRGELPDLYTQFQGNVLSGRMTPEQAANAYLAASRGAGEIKGSVAKAGKLAGLQQGIPAAEDYARFRPFMDISAQQLLGKPLSDADYQNYVSAFQGMGITNPQDVAASFGKMLTTSRDYRANEVIFRPEVIEEKMLKSKTEESPAYQAFQTLLS